ncbi:MAG: VWA domain-containing protein [Acidimicrobiia bacterium]|nr:VWA domain-containing protein [Acidimicrobiia bacterium]
MRPQTRVLRAVWLVVATAAAATSLYGQAGSRERALFVSAVDGKGEPVEGLSVNDFVVTEDGRRREVLRVSRAVEPMAIALLIDNSAAADDVISIYRSALPKFVARMAADGNQIAVIGLAARPTVLTDYTPNARQLEQGIGRIFAQTNDGMTLLDALVESSTGLRRREETRAVLVPIVTDGTEFSNRYSRDVIAAIRGAGASLHAVTIGNFPVATDIQREREFTIAGGTRDTGGQRIMLLTELGLDDVLQRLARQLSSQYKVVYGRPESFLPPEDIEVMSAKPGITMRGTPARGQTGA